MPKLNIKIVHEFPGFWQRDRDILDDVGSGEVGLVQRVVHDAGVHEVVEKEAGDAVEGREEVGEGVAADPEAAAVVAEEVGC